MTNGLRFRVTDDTNHSCCHEAAVVDTHKPNYGDAEKYGYEIVCECAEEAQARRIADLLNMAEPISSGVH